MKKRIKQAAAGFAKVVCFIIVFSICMCVVERTLKDKDNYLKYTLFYEEEEPFDVLFFGSSRMLDAVYPMELWKEYGLTSYNMAQHSENLLVTYWQMVNAFQYNRPEIAVVDMSLYFGGIIGGDDESAKSYLHKSLDHMPLTVTKYKAVRALTKEDVDISEYLFPFVIYHNRWNQLKRNDIYPVPSGQKGAERRIGITPMERMEWCSDEISSTFDADETGLENIVKLCEENDVQLVLTCMPSVWSAGDPNVSSTMNYIEVYAAERGIPFLNYAKEDDVINYAVDFYDSSHVNPSGGKKITCCLGEFLAKNYEIPSPKKEATIKKWEESFQDYKYEVKAGGLINAKNANNLRNYLMLLNDDDFTYKIELPGEESVETLGIRELLEELGAQDEIDYGLAEYAARIIVYDAESMQIIDIAEFR